MGRNWTNTSNNRGNVLRTSYQKGVVSNATIKPQSNIHYVEVDLEGSDITLTGDSSESLMADEIRITIKNTGVESVLTFAGDFEGTTTNVNTGEIEAISFFCNGSKFVVNGLNSETAVSLDNEIVVNQSNVSTTLGGVIDSTKEYFIDGIIDLGTTQITVPTTGITLKGYSFDISGLTSSEDNYTMFISESIAIGSGNVLGSDYLISVTGAASKVYELYDTTGFNAFEFQRVNYNDCTSLGDIYDYRQGLETGTGRFGGSPSLTLHGIWGGGYRITTSIVRSLAGTMTEPLFKEGLLFQMNSRFLTDINVDLPTLAPLLDFQPVNFPNSSTLQIRNAIISRDGNVNPNDTNITPNISEIDLASNWKNNVGLNNTYVGGTINCILDTLTTINTINVWETLGINTLTSGLEHMDSPSAGQLRNLGISPREFEVTANFNIDGNPNADLEVRFTKWDNSQSLNVPLDYTIQKRPVNNLSGGRDVAFFIMTVGVTLDINDYLFVEVRNTTGNQDITLELGSYYRVQER